jgi:hypothetical protein
MLRCTTTINPTPRYPPQRDYTLKHEELDMLAKYKETSRLIRRGV